MWDATAYEAKENLLRVVRQEAERFFALAAAPGVWDRPTACPQWSIRHLVGHLIDVTEGYFVGFDAARGGPAAPAPLGMRDMARLLDEGARRHEHLSTVEALERLRVAFTKLMDLSAALGPQEWGGLIVPHRFMGPLPAYFYPAFQLMDYAVHSWDIRQGAGRAHALDSEAADLLVPFMFVFWQSTASSGAMDGAAGPVGVRVTGGPNAGTWRFTAGPAGISYQAGPVDDVAAILDFDPGSLVLTAFGRCNAGTVRGDAATAEHFLNGFFRV